MPRGIFFYFASTDLAIAVKGGEGAGLNDAKVDVTTNIGAEVGSARVIFGDGGGQLILFGRLGL